MDAIEKGVGFDSYELMALESVLSPSEVMAGGEGKMLSPAVLSKELCLKIGSALIQAREIGGAVDIVLSETECWALRERVNIFMSIGQRHDVGLTIKLKLYQLLLAYAFAREAGEFETADHEERSARAVREGLEGRAREQGTKDTS